MEAVLLTALAGKTLWQGCLNASGGGGMGSAGRTLAGASCGGKIAGTMDMSAKHRALPATQQKFKDAGLNPDSASKHALGAAQLTFDDRSRGGTKSGGSKGKSGGNMPGCGLGSHSAPRRKTETTQLNYLAYCASPAGKANFANMDINTAPAHYSELLELTPPVHVMNAIGPNKARVTLKSKQSKTKAKT
jgi:hypothetical protein